MHQHILPSLLPTLTADSLEVRRERGILSSQDITAAKTTGVRSLAATRSIINMGFRHLTALYGKGGLDLECPHQTTQHLHGRPHGTLAWTLAQCSGQNDREAPSGRAVLTAGLWVQGVWGCSVAPQPLSHGVTSHFGGANGLMWQRKGCCAKTARNPGQAAAGAYRGCDIVCGRLNLPGVAYTGLE